jgi:hypothetical protein
MPDAPEHITERGAAGLPPVIHLPYAPLPADPPLAPKKPKRKRPNVVGVRLDDAELAQLETKAREAGLSIGGYVRASALGDAGPRSRKRVTVDRELLARATAALNRVGGNWNQIAHAFNAGGSVAHGEIAATGRAIEDTLTVIRQALGYDRQG